MQTPQLTEVVDVLHGLWRLDDLGMFESESGWAALLAMEGCLLEWVATAPDWVFDPAPEPSPGQCDEVPGQDVLPFGGED
jgi:hypothetical protein